MADQPQQARIKEINWFEAQSDIDLWPKNMDEISFKKQYLVMPTNPINPKDIRIIEKGATYGIPRFKVTDEGLVKASDEIIFFCKGSKADPTIFRQPGFITESLLEVCRLQLEAVNQDVPSEHTTAAIAHLRAALDALEARQKDRVDRGVAQTYKP